MANATQLAQGMGMGMRFLTDLIKKVEEQGGCGEMIHFMTTKDGEKYLDEVAEFISSLRWKQSMRKVMKEARQWYIDGNDKIEDEDEVVSFMHFSAYYGLHYSISRTWFGAGEKISYLPKEILDTLHDKEAKAFMPVVYEGEEYVVVALNTCPGLMPGDVIHKDKIVTMCIAPAKFFINDL